MNFKILKIEKGDGKCETDSCDEYITVSFMSIKTKDDIDDAITILKCLQTEIED